MKIKHFKFLILILLSTLSCKEKEEKDNTKPEIRDFSKHTEKQKYPELYDLILKKDSVLFQAGFNQIDTHQVAQLISKDFEFYHDEHGLMETKSDFLLSIYSLHDLPFKTWRTLKTETVKVFPLYTENKSKLYGILQTGEHEFFQQKKHAEAQRTSLAKFNHLWILENNEWKLKRVLSYDHQNLNNVRSE